MLWIPKASTTQSREGSGSQVLRKAKIYAFNLKNRAWLTFRKCPEMIKEINLRVSCTIRKTLKCCRIITSLQTQKKIYYTEENTKKLAAKFRRKISVICWWAIRILKIFISLTST